MIITIADLVKLAIPELKTAQQIYEDATAERVRYKDNDEDLELMESLRRVTGPADKHAMELKRALTAAIKEDRLKATKTDAVAVDDWKIEFSARVKVWVYNWLLSKGLVIPESLDTKDGDMASKMLRVVRKLGIDPMALKRGDWDRSIGEYQTEYSLTKGAANKAWNTCTKQGFIAKRGE